MPRARFTPRFLPQCSTDCGPKPIQSRCECRYENCLDRKLCLHVLTTTRHSCLHCDTLPTMTPDLLDERNQRIVLGTRLGAGGEGSVFEVAGTSDLAAKVYHDPPDSARIAKLQAM